MEQSPLVTDGTPRADVGARRGSVEKVTGGDGDKLASGMVDLFGGCLV